MPTASHPHRHASFLVVIVPVVLAALGLAACSSTSTPAPRGAATSSTTARPTTTTTRTTSPSSTSTTTGTQEVAYDPYTAQGTANPTLQVTQTVSGTCVGAGVAGATSYRCFAQPDNEVYDPCFAPPHATQGPLLCVPAPNVTDVVQFDVGALPAPPSGAPASRVWAMQLANGQVCVLVDAAWSGLGPFACPTPAPADSQADCHAPIHGTGGWTAPCQAAETSSSPFTTLGVVTVWS